MDDKDDAGIVGGRDIPPWLQPVPEDEPELSFWQAKRTVIISASIAIVLIGLFVAALVLLYDDAAPERPRHVAAPTTPVREKPDAPGGMKVEHQDKGVYDQIDGARPDSRVALAEQPEQPVDLPADDKPEDTTDVVKSVLDDMQKAAPARPEQKAEPEPKAVQKTTPEATEPAQSEAKPAFRVQLGAYSSEKSAAGAWRTIKGKFPRQLGDKEPVYEAVSAGDRTLYRLRVGPLHTRAEADQVCLGLRAGSQACIVVNP